MTDVRTPTEWLTVVLLGLPVELHQQVSAHGDALRRELEFLRRADPSHDSAPHRLHELVDRLETRYGDLGAGLDLAVREAARRGDSTIDAEIALPPDVGPACDELAELLDEIDEYCRQGEHLLTLAAPPAGVAYRRWFLGQLAAQLAGSPAVAWVPPPPEDAPLDDPPHPTRVVVERSDDGDPRVVVDDDLDLECAPELRVVVNELRAEGHRRVVVDLSNCGFVDSLGLSVLVAAHSRLGDDGGELRIVTNPGVRRILEITGLERVLHLGES